MHGVLAMASLGGFGWHFDIHAGPVKLGRVQTVGACFAFKGGPSMHLEFYFMLGCLSEFAQGLHWRWADRPGFTAAPWQSVGL